MCLFLNIFNTKTCVTKFKFQQLPERYTNEDGTILPKYKLSQKQVYIIQYSVDGSSQILTFTQFKLINYCIPTFGPPFMQFQKNIVNNKGGFIQNILNIHKEKKQSNSEYDILKTDRSILSKLHAYILLRIIGFELPVSHKIQYEHNVSIGLATPKIFHCLDFSKYQLSA